MLRILIPILLLLIGVGAGVGAGLFLQAGEEAAAADGSAEETESSEAEAAQDSSQSTAPAAPGSTEFVRLNNQFVVPVVQDGLVRSLVVISLTIEVDTGENSAVFDREPRLRDAFLREMFTHANVGGFEGYFTDASALAPLRSALRESAVGILGGIVHDVLIVDITRQDA